MARFLIALILLLVVAPLVTDLKRGDLIEATLLTLVLGTGIFAVGARRNTFGWALALALPGIVCRWLNALSPGLLPQAVVFITGGVFLIFVAGTLVHFTMRAPRVDSEVLCAGISTYLLLGLIWSLAYRFIAALTADAFAFTAGPAGSQSMTPFNAVYFSFITLTTVGYGDIVPISKGARLLAAMEAITGTFFVGVFIARLVSLYSTIGPPNPPTPSTAESD